MGYFNKHGSLKNSAVLVKKYLFKSSQQSDKKKINIILDWKYSHQMLYQLWVLWTSRSEKVFSVPEKQMLPKDGLLGTVAHELHMSRLHLLISSFWCSLLWLEKMIVGIPIQSKICGHLCTISAILLQTLQIQFSALGYEAEL